MLRSVHCVVLSVIIWRHQSRSVSSIFVLASFRLRYFTLCGLHRTRSTRYSRFTNVANIRELLRFYAARRDTTGRSRVENSETQLTASWMLCSIIKDPQLPHPRACCVRRAFALTLSATFSPPVFDRNFGLRRRWSSESWATTRTRLS